MRRLALAVLGFGVVAGFGSAFAHARGHAMCHSDWERSERFDDRQFDGPAFGERRGFERAAPAAVAPQAPVAPVIVQSAPAQAAPSQVFIVMPGATGVPAVVNAAPAAPAPAPAQTVTPAPNGQ